MRTIAVYASLGVLVLVGCKGDSEAGRKPVQRGSKTATVPKEAATVQTPDAPRREKPVTMVERLASAAEAQVGVTMTYDPSYVGLAYPGGDVPADRGVCTDVVVRALRGVDIDLQVLIHEDMKASFKSYPNLWGLKRPDRNIDHRRVPNIAAFLRRKGKAAALTRDAGDYLPGDIVVWRLSNGRPHMGIVSSVRARGKERYSVVHNIGAGAKLEDSLFEFEITGHFRYF